MFVGPEKGDSGGLEGARADQHQREDFQRHTVEEHLCKITTLKTFCLFDLSECEYSPAARFRLLNMIMMENPHVDESHDQ